MLAQFTLLPMAEIAALVDEHAAAPGRRRAQRALAREVTDLVHGAEAAPGRRGGQRDPLRRRPPAGVAGGAGGGGRRGARAPRWPPGEYLGARGRPRPGAPAGRAGVVPERRPAPARAGRRVGERREGRAGPAARRRTTCSTTAGCCCARGRRGWAVARCSARRVDTSPDPPIGCPSAPRRPRHRRAATGRATPAPPLH